MSYLDKKKSYKTDYFKKCYIHQLFSTSKTIEIVGPQFLTFQCLSMEILR